jgi:hypothetical protein
MALPGTLQIQIATNDVNRGKHTLGEPLRKGPIGPQRLATTSEGHSLEAAAIILLAPLASNPTSKEES